MAVKYNFKADIEFTADDMESAIEMLEKHFAKMLTFFLTMDNGSFIEPNQWFSGKMTLKDGDGEEVSCEGKL